MEKREYFVKESPFKKTRKFNTFQRYLENGNKNCNFFGKCFVK